VEEQKLREAIKETVKKYVKWYLLTDN
jgi:hypothetical protein